MQIVNSPSSVRENVRYRNFNFGAERSGAIGQYIIDDSNYSVMGAGIYCEKPINVGFTSTKT